MKIAQISDVHSADLERPLGAALAAAAPDLIVMTGDLVNREDRELSRALSLARMTAETAPAFLPRATMRGTTPAGRSCGTGWRRPACRCWRTGRSCGASGGGVNLMGLWDVTHDPLGWAHAQAALPERVRHCAGRGR